GGDAAGMSAASQAKRLRGDRLEVLAFERGAHSSYSACGIPYWVAGDVPDGEQLVARTPEAHRANGIDLRMLTEVEAIDLQAGTGASPCPGLGPPLPGRVRPPGHRHRGRPGATTTSRLRRRRRVRRPDPGRRGCAPGRPGTAPTATCRGHRRRLHRRGDGRGPGPPPGGGDRGRPGPPNDEHP